MLKGILFQGWSSLWASETLSRAKLYDLISQKQSFLVTNTQSLFGVKKWDCFPRKGPGNLVRVHDIMGSKKYWEMANGNLAFTSDKKLKRGRI